MKNFDWTAWIISVVVTTVFVFHTFQVWNGRVRNSVTDGQFPNGEVNTLARRFAKSYVPISGIFVSFVILSVSKHGADVIATRTTSDILRGIFYLACVMFLCSAIASVSIVSSGGPEFLVPPPLRRNR